MQIINNILGGPLVADPSLLYFFLKNVIFEGVLAWKMVQGEILHFYMIRYSGGHLFK
jgi:hypothetical protein